MPVVIRVLVFVLLVTLGPLARADAPVILVLGDSLSAAYGIAPSEGWVQRLQGRLEAGGYPHRVVNASISGETSTGGLNRLQPLLDRHHPHLVLIELGANDGLRGQPVARLRDNLVELVRRSRAAGAEAVLFEMRIPSNYGAQYTEQFFQGFGTVAQAESVPLVPFFLAAIAEDERWFQRDGIHPNAEAQPLMLEAVWPTLEPLLAASKSGATP